jgi:hypothetical protein
MAEQPKPKTEAKTESKAETKTESAASVPYLTKANWTPDIVASLLASSAGMFLGGVLAFLHLFVPVGGIIGAVLVLLVAWFFAFTCRHMELEGRRFVQQAYLLLTPLLFIFLIVVFVIQVAINLLLGKVQETIGAQEVMGIPLSDTSLTGLVPHVAGLATASNTGLLVIIYTAVVLLPFIVIAAHRRWLRWWHLLLAIVPIALGVLLMSM